MNARRFALTCWALTGVLLVFSGGARLAGLRLNTSASAPEGVWRVLPLQGEPERGMLVEVCPPVHPAVAAMRDGGYLPPGPCAPGVAAFLKPVAAIAGDLVSIRQGQPVAVNGREVVGTMPASNMPAWPDGDYRVAPGTLWLLSNYSEYSFDSRYFGPVPVFHVRGKAEPVFTRGDVAALALGMQP